MFKNLIILAISLFIFESKKSSACEQENEPNTPHAHNLIVSQSEHNTHSLREQNPSSIRMLLLDKYQGDVSFYFAAIAFSASGMAATKYFEGPCHFYIVASIAMLESFVGLLFLYKFMYEDIKGIS